MTDAPRGVRTFADLARELGNAQSRARQTLGGLDVHVVSNLEHCTIPVWRDLPALVADVDATLCDVITTVELRRIVWTCTVRRPILELEQAFRVGDALGLEVVPDFRAELHPRDVGWCRRVLREANPGRWTNRRIRRMRIRDLRRLALEWAPVDFLFVANGYAGVALDAGRAFIRGPYGELAAAHLVEQEIKA